MKRQIMDDTAQEERKTKRAKRVKNQEMTLLYAEECVANIAEFSELCAVPSIVKHLDRVISNHINKFYD